MLKDRKSRMLLTAFGGLFLLVGGGTTGTALAAKLGAVLTGDNIAGAAGDQDGWGRVLMSVDDTFNSVCADIEVRSVGDVTSVVVYRGAAGENGDPVVKLDAPNDNNDSDDCDRVGDTLADEIQANPAGFYVAVTTAEHPNGAIRGQLGPAGD